jgi:hypothetical protein
VRPKELQGPRKMVTRSFPWSLVLCSVLGGLPTKLWLTVQCWRQAPTLKRVGLGFMRLENRMRSCIWEVIEEVCVIRVSLPQSVAARWSANSAGMQ